MRDGAIPFPLHVLFNPVNQGYGGNQKIGYHFAIERGFDFVALVHGDGQYAPECLPELVRPLRDGEADAVFGSRMLEKAAALRGGMPLYKYVGNKILTGSRTACSASSLSEFHSGYRVYAVAALKQIPFALNTNDFHFDTEIIVQLMLGGTADQGAADSDLLRRRDLPGQRHEVRLGRDQGRAGGALAAAGPVLRSPLRLRAGVSGQRALSAEARLPQPAHASRSRSSRTAPACSISAAPAATSAPRFAASAAAG